MFLAWSNAKKCLQKRKRCDNLYTDSNKHITHRKENIMALQWKWNEKCGEAVLQQTIDGETRDFTLNLYTGNAFLIMIHEFKEETHGKLSWYH